MLVDCSSVGLCLTALSMQIGYTIATELMLIQLQLIVATKIVIVMWL